MNVKKTEEFDVPKSDNDWQATLSPTQYKVLRCHGTEMPGSSRSMPEAPDVCVRRLRNAFVSRNEVRERTGWPSLRRARLWAPRTALIS